MKSREKSKSSQMIYFVLVLKVIEIFKKTLFIRNSRFYSKFSLFSKKKIKTEKSSSKKHSNILS